MKTKNLTILVLLLCFFTQSGCFKKKIIFSNELEGTLTIVGSSSTQEVCELLANKFSKKYKKVKVVKSGAGSAQAAIAVADGTAQIGDLSRELNFDEQPDRFTSHTIALDGIAVCTNLSNNVKNLTQTQLKKIFTGQIKNWAELGGQNASIVVVGRDEASGTRASFERLIDAKNCSYVIVQDSNGKVKEKIKNNKNAIGYISFSSVDNSIKTLSIDGTCPNEQNILNSTYKLSQPIIQITQKNCNDELTTAWFNFIKSQTGQQTIKQAKLVPLT